jgi:hypothetical protein
MILFELQCANDHRFEAWFRDGAAYEQQAAGGDIECPYCASVEVAKAPMSPSLAAGSSSDGEARAQYVARKVLHDLDRLQTHVEETCEDVGDRFAEEARAIHHGEAEPRPIHGEATEEEAIDLAEEEIEFHRISWRRKKDS